MHQKTEDTEAKLLAELTQAVATGQQVEATKELTNKALNLGCSPLEILNQGLLPGMNTIGERFSRGEAYIPELLFSGRAMQAAIEILRPLLAEMGAKPVGKFVLGTVANDLHDIGKDLVGMMLEGAGFKVFNLGINVPTQRFIEVVEQEEAPLLGLSALLNITMPEQAKIIEALIKNGLRDKVKVIVGGASLTQAFADEIGADGYAPDAVLAVSKAKELLKLS